MKPTNYNQVALFEHRFWLQVLGDHARFIFDNLSPDEKEEIQKAHYFIYVFDQLLNKARTNLSEAAIMELNQEATLYAQEIRLFKLHLIQRQLVGNIVIGLPPTFINHMVTEVEEYLRVLCFLIDHKIPVFHPIDLHLAWLLDAAGHAAAVSGDVDMVEKKVIEKSDEFTERFEEMYIKAVEIADYMRTGLTQFPALNRFNVQVADEITMFKVFLRELEKLELSKQLLGTVTALMLDHMAREECYYLVKLAQVTALQPPPCDPTKPRTEMNPCQEVPTQPIKSMTVAEEQDTPEAQSDSDAEEQ
ncbi:hypothetical protein BHU72_01185 [Desulfuribacillus stibiiarsenatis]|uniref:DUF2935 domain-containing protein n=1 Tax=Desulfuribacillus stibiiarsenatis TaxID=1390249 RepID=A0A1E5LA26_9FIRM|nr:DUF2935 domain-containing protein [Desulfuribacillus stibiiarsenatis]OEH86904.1 hypothetical protein BHU72_01185 [Desulfuribacillus stibiiarsenatis]